MNFYPIDNYHVIKVKFLGATNNGGEKVLLISERFEQRKSIPYDYEYNASYEIAEAWLTGNGYELIGKAEGKDCYYIISKTFKPFRERKK